MCCVICIIIMLCIYMLNSSALRVHVYACTDLVLENRFQYLRTLTKSIINAILSSTCH